MRQGHHGLASSKKSSNWILLCLVMIHSPRSEVMKEKTRQLNHEEDFLSSNEMGALEEQQRISRQSVYTFAQDRKSLF
jgi:hypothetical protein